MIHTAINGPQVGKRKPALWTDAELLRALRLRDAGLTARQIGERMGKTRGSVIGVLGRIDTEFALSEGC